MKCRMLARLTITISSVIQISTTVPDAGQGPADAWPECPGSSHLRWRLISRETCRTFELFLFFNKKSQFLAHGNTKRPDVSERIWTNACAFPFKQYALNSNVKDKLCRGKSSDFLISARSKTHIMHNSADIILLTRE